MNILNIVKKVSIGIIAAIVLLIGGLYIFITTQGDYILEQISLIVEEATGSPLIIEEMPTVGFSPMPNIGIHKVSWGNDEMSVAFESASVHFSILKLLQGEVDISEVALHSPRIFYDDTKTVASTSEEAEETSFEELLAPAPKNIIMTNAYIEYKDKDQHLIMENFNLNISNFSVNKSVDMNMASLVSYTMLADKSNYTFDFDMKSNFVLTNDNIDFNMSSMALNPKAGFGFTAPMTFDFKALIDLDTLDFQNFSTNIKSSFMNMNIAQKGMFNLDNMNMAITSTIYPKTMGKVFDIEIPDTKELDSMKFNTNLAYADDIANFSNMQINFGETSFTSSIIYDMKKDSIKGDFALANLNMNNYFPPSAEEEASTSTASEPILMPDMLVKTSFDLGMKMTNITYDTIVLDSFDTRMTGSNSRLLMNSIAMQVLGSAINMSLDLDLSSKQFAITSINIPSLNIARYAKALMDMDGLSGTMSLNTKLSCSILDPFANLNGSGEMVFSSLGVESSKLGTLSKILLAAKMENDTFEFADGKIPYTITNSVVKLTNAYFNSNKYYVASNGTVNLKTDALNLEVQAGNSSKSTVPLTISGTMSEPKVTITMQNIVNTATQIIESKIDTEAIKENITNEVNKVTEQVTEKVTEKVNEEINKAAGNLLNSIIKK